MTDQILATFPGGVLLILRLPDGAGHAVAASGPVVSPGPEEPPHPAEMVAQVFPAAEFAPLPSQPWVCPIHGSNKIVPAGVSRKTGKPYNAFVACGEQGCDNKPPR